MLCFTSAFKDIVFPLYKFGTYFCQFVVLSNFELNFFMITLRHY